MKTKENITKRIKTLDDALQATGRPEVPEFSDLPKDLRKYFQSQYKAIVIAEALNEGWKASWEVYEEVNPDKLQKDRHGKYIPWFRYKPPSGLVFRTVLFGRTNPDAGCSHRLCFKTEDLAAYAGMQFLDIWKELIFK